VKCFLWVIKVTHLVVIVNQVEVIKVKVINVEARVSHLVKVTHLVDIVNQVEVIKVKVINVEARVSH